MIGDLNSWDKFCNYLWFDKNLNIWLDISKINFTNDEIRIFRKIAEWPQCIILSSKRLEPHRLTTYLYELSSEFHSYWNLGNKDMSKRFIEDNKISDEKIVFLKIISNVIKSGMNIIGVDTPEKM